MGLKPAARLLGAEASLELDVQLFGNQGCVDRVPHGDARGARRSGLAGPPGAILSGRLWF